MATHTIPNIVPDKWVDKEHTKVLRYRAVIEADRNSDGSRNRKYFYGKTKKEVQTKVQDYYSELDNAKNSILDDDRFTIQVLMDMWLDKVKSEGPRKVKAKSLDRLKSTVYTNILPYIGSMKVRDIKPYHINDLLSTLTEKYNDGGYSSVRKVYLALSACFRNLCALEYIEYNPCASIICPKSSQFDNSHKGIDDDDVKYYNELETKILIAESIRTYKDGTQVYRLGQAYKLLFYTGMRIGELCGLSWNDVDMVRDEQNQLIGASIHIHGQVIQYNDWEWDGEKPKGRTYKQYQNSTKTKTSKRTVIISNKPALDAINSLYELTGTLSCNKNNMVLCNKEGEYCGPNAMDHTWRRILRATGLNETKNYGLHSLRHTYATMLFKYGESIQVISGLLGHDSPEITSRIYVHILREMKAEASMKLPDLG